MSIRKFAGRIAVVAIALSMIFVSTVAMFPAIAAENPEEAGIIAGKESNDQATTEEAAMIQKPVDSQGIGLNDKINRNGGAAGNILRGPQRSVYTEDDFAMAYKDKKFTLSGMPIVDEGGNKITDPITLRFWNATLQRYEATVTSVNGVLPDVEMIGEQHYIVYSEDKNYEFADGNNAYIKIYENGHTVNKYNEPASKQPFNIDKFTMKKRAAAVEDPVEARRVKVNLALWYWDNDLEDFDFYEIDDWVATNTTLVFTSPIDEVELPITEDTIDNFGNVSVNLLEDCAYTVSVKSETLTMYQYPLVVKDHSERNDPKLPYNHLSCNGKKNLFLFDKNAEATPGTLLAQAYLTTLTSISGKTTVDGWNFDQKKLPFPEDKSGQKTKYALNEKNLDKSIAKGIAGDFEVKYIHSMNMYRHELSRIKLPGNDMFTVTTAVTVGKKVKSLSYIDDKGKLQPLKFEQVGDNIKFKMATLSMYPIVIQYGGTNGDTQYAFVKADNGGVWHKKDNESLGFEFSTSDANDTLESFSGVSVDDEMLDAKDYEVSYNDSKFKIALKPEYLETLAVQGHKLKARFDGGSKRAEADFNVKTAMIKSVNFVFDEPKVGDDIKDVTTFKADPAEGLKMAKAIWLEKGKADPNDDITYIPGYKEAKGKFEAGKTYYLIPGDFEVNDGYEIDDNNPVDTTYNGNKADTEVSFAGITGMMYSYTVSKQSMEPGKPGAEPDKQTQPKDAKTAVKPANVSNFVKTADNTDFGIYVVVMIASVLILTFAVKKHNGN